MLITGKIIREERLLKNLTQRRLADILGVTQDSVSLWEKGKRLPATEHIIALCRFFKISADYLLGLDEQN